VLKRRKNWTEKGRLKGRYEAADTRPGSRLVCGAKGKGGGLTKLSTTSVFARGEKKRNSKSFPVQKAKGSRQGEGLLGIPANEQVSAKCSHMQSIVRRMEKKGEEAQTIRKSTRYEKIGRDEEVSITYENARVLQRWIKTARNMRKTTSTSPRVSGGRVVKKHSSYAFPKPSRNF